MLTRALAMTFGLALLGSLTGCGLCRPGGWFNNTVYAPPPPAYPVAPTVEMPPVYGAPVQQNCCPPCCPPVTTAP